MDGRKPAHGPTTIGPDFLAAGEPARLFPVLSESSREGRALSILLSCMRFAPVFGGTLIAEFGHRLRARSRLETYTEVTLKHGDSQRGLRPDGLISVTTGNRQQWNALVEAKVRGAKLDNHQIAAYLDLAKANGVSAVVTLSNDFAAIPSHHPTYAARLPNGVSLFHLSWTSILTHAKLLLANDGVEADHRLLLGELARFLEHRSTGVSHFDRMPANWKELVTAVMAGASPNRGADSVTDAVASWHQETRDLALQITQMVNARVAIRMPRKHAGDPRKRVADDAAQLCDKAVLRSEFDVPSAAATIAIEADLRRRTISVAMSLRAPEDRVSTRARVNWLLRQIQRADATDIHMVAHWRHHAAVQAALSEVRSDPAVLEPTSRPVPASAFTVMLVRDAAGRFAGSRTFVAELEEVVPRFYEQVGQRLKAWRPVAPQVQTPVAADAPPAAEPAPAPEGPKADALPPPVGSTRTTRPPADDGVQPHSSTSGSSTPHDSTAA